MIHDPDILNLLESLQITAWRGTVFRHMFADFPPTRTNDNGARWNPPGVSAIYTSTERDTVLAEAEHRISLEPFRPRAKRTIYSLAVELGVVIDLRDPQRLAAVGISEATLVQLDFTPCQSIRDDGHDSARRRTRAARVRRAARECGGRASSADRAVAGGGSEAPLRAARGRFSCARARRRSSRRDGRLARDHRP
jgi:RES domain-containing protein